MTASPGSPTTFATTSRCPEARRSATTVALYYSPGACSLAPHVALQEIGKPFELRLADARGKRLADNPEYLRVNPRGRIPALDVDGRLLTENAAIMAWLAMQHPEAGLWPIDPVARARCLEMLASLLWQRPAIRRAVEAEGLARSEW
jgi:glutathione S-transferase